MLTTKNFYVVLGVPTTETAAGIRHAFRELAHRYHPDRVGTQGTRFFQEIVEAYHVLSDPERRASYDEGLRHAGEEFPPRPPVTPAPAPRAQPEPLVPGRVLHDALDFELTLSPEEAAQGGVLTFGVPVIYPCRSCRSTGLTGYLGELVCHVCGGQGVTPDEEEVRLVIPRFVRDGTLIRLPVRALGIRGLYLRVLIHVRPRRSHAGISNRAEPLR